MTNISTVYDKDKTQNITFTTKKLSFKVRLHMVTCSLKNINVISMKGFEIIIEKKKFFFNNIGKSQCIYIR